MAVYIVAFDRIGRTHKPASLMVTADSADQIAEKIHTHARHFLLSRYYEVHVDLAQGKGWILCGYQNGGEFTIHDSTSAAVA